MDPGIAADLGRQAYAAMAASFAPLPRGLLASFRLWHFPESGPDTSWAVFHPGEGEPMPRPPRVRRIRWDRAADLRGLELSLRRRPKREPALVTSEAELDAVEIGRLMKEAGSLGLPRHHFVRPYVSERRAEFGLEGFDLEGRVGPRVIRIEWDRHPPLALEGVVHWADRARAWLEALPGYRDL